MVHKVERQAATSPTICCPAPVNLNGWQNSLKSGLWKCSCGAIRILPNGILRGQDSIKAEVCPQSSRKNKCVFRFNQVVPRVAIRFLPVHLATFNFLRQCEFEPLTKCGHNRAYSVCTNLLSHTLFGFRSNSDSPCQMVSFLKLTL